MIPTSAAASAYAATKQLGTGAAFKGLAGTAGAGAAPAGQGFGQFLSETLNGVVDSGRKAESQAAAAASGKSNLVDVVTAVAESETALQTLVAVRDRVIAAYEEIMRMQV